MAIQKVLLNTRQFPLLQKRFAIHGVAAHQSIAADRAKLTNKTQQS